VYSLEGGIRAWKGMIAHGPPEAGMAYFAPAADAEEIVGLAWALEEGSKMFYLGVAENFTDDKEAQEMFRWLVAAEKSHEQHLLDTYESLVGGKPDFEKLRKKFTDKLGGSVMEGGIVVKEALDWIKGKGVKDSLELAMAMEVNAFDLYVKMSRSIDDQNAQQIFEKLSVEEQVHLEKLAKLLDKRI
jgi:sulfur-carrier protein adenylyltransferase/sulfurtransferase